VSSLRDLQRDFMRAILQEPASRAALRVLPDGIAVEQRLQVYAVNARVNFLSALESSYPVIRRLVGAAYFEQCARGFQREHPSRSGDLQPAGAMFPAYIEALHRDGEYRYLGDVARFEWLVQEALLAAEHAPLDLGKLAAILPADYDNLLFQLHPSLRLFDSSYPCFAIWQANSAAAEPPVIDLNGAPRERIAIVHSARLHGATDLRFHALSAGEHAFLKALETRTPIAGAVHAGAVHAGAAQEFDAGAALRRFVLAAAIVDFQ
jgi:Putative DNA-binding domain